MKTRLKFEKKNSEMKLNKDMPFIEVVNAAVNLDMAPIVFYKEGILEEYRHEGEITVKRAKQYVGNVIEKHMTLNNVSQKNLARMLGLERSTISYYKTGKAMPLVGNLEKIIKILGLTHEYMVLRDALKIKYKGDFSEVAQTLEDALSGNPDFMPKGDLKTRLGNLRKAKKYLTTLETRYRKVKS